MSTTTRRRALTVCLAIAIPSLLGAAAAPAPAAAFDLAAPWNVTITPSPTAGDTLKVTVHDAPGGFPVSVIIKCNNATVFQGVITVAGGTVAWPIPLDKEEEIWQVICVDASGDIYKRSGLIQ